MSEYLAVRYDETGAVADRRAWSCRRQATAQEHAVKLFGANAIIKLMGRTGYWYCNGKWSNNQPAVVTARITNDPE